MRSQSAVARTQHSVCNSDALILHLDIGMELAPYSTFTFSVDVYELAVYPELRRGADRRVPYVCGILSLLSHATASHNSRCSCVEKLVVASECAQREFISYLFQRHVFNNGVPEVVYSALRQRQVYHSDRKGGPEVEKGGT